MSEADLEAVYRAIAAPRRRIAVSCLQRHHQLTLPDLSEMVTERETGRALHEVDAERVSETYFSLYHTHVPKLEAARLASYDQETDRVVRGEDLDAVLERARLALSGLTEQTQG